MLMSWSPIEHLHDLHLCGITKECLQFPSPVPNGRLPNSSALQVGATANLSRAGLSGNFVFSASRAPPWDYSI